jgi:hypothetical protein
MFLRRICCICWCDVHLVERGKWHAVHVSMTLVFSDDAVAQGALSYHVNPYQQTSTTSGLKYFGFRRSQQILVLRHRHRTSRMSVSSM